VLLSGHEPRVFHPHASLLVPAVISAVSDPFYKISSEALLVLQLLVKVFLSAIFCHSCSCNMIIMNPVLSAFFAFSSLFR
jgi:hypothetical protein